MMASSSSSIGAFATSVVRTASAALAGFAGCAGSADSLDMRVAAHSSALARAAVTSAIGLRRHHHQTATAAARTLTTVRRTRTFRRNDRTPRALRAVALELHAHHLAQLRLDLPGAEQLTRRDRLARYRSGRHHE